MGRGAVSCPLTRPLGRLGWERGGREEGTSLGMAWAPQWPAKPSSDKVATFTTSERPVAVPVRMWPHPRGQHPLLCGFLVGPLGHMFAHSLSTLWPGANSPSISCLPFSPLTPQPPAAPASLRLPPPKLDTAIASSQNTFSLGIR